MKKILKTNKNYILLLLLLLIAVILTLRSFQINKRYQSPPLSGSERTFSVTELAKFDGSDPSLPIYIGLDGLVYDVSAGREDFYNPGKSYNYLAGKDSSEQLHIAGGAIIKRKYQVVGSLENN